MCVCLFVCKVVVFDGKKSSVLCKPLEGVLCDMQTTKTSLWNGIIMFLSLSLFHHGVMRRAIITTHHQIYLSSCVCFGNTMHLSPSSCFFFRIKIPSSRLSSS